MERGLASIRLLPLGSISLVAVADGRPLFWEPIASHKPRIQNSGLRIRGIPLPGRFFQLLDRPKFQRRYSRPMFRIPRLVSAKHHTLVP